MAEKFTDPWANGRKGIDILVDILSCSEPATVNRILQSMQKDMPQVVLELKRRLVLFEDLAFADQRGVQKLLKRVNLRDLALSLKGAPDAVLQNLADNMSQRMIQDLRDEIVALGPKITSETPAARAKIITLMRELINSHELFIDRRNQSDSVRTVL